MSRGKEILVDLLYDIAGSILYAAGLVTFAGSADFAPGGVSGLSLILNRICGIPVGILTLVLNIPLVIISYRTVGKRFLLKTAKTMVIVTFFLDVIFPLFPVYRGQRIVAALYAGIFLGSGMVLFYMRGSSSGGIDFLTLSIKKKKPHLSIGKITMLADLVIILLGWPVFGDVDAVLYGLVSTFSCIIVIDKILYGIGAGTLAVVITEKGEQAARQIGQITERGVTLIEAVGAYTGGRKYVLMCACSKSEAYMVKMAVYQVDERAFLMFTETSEVFGEGFQEKKLQ